MYLFFDLCPWPCSVLCSTLIDDFWRNILSSYPTLEQYLQKGVFTMTSIRVKPCVYLCYGHFLQHQSTQHDTRAVMDNNKPVRLVSQQCVKVCHYNIVVNYYMLPKFVHSLIALHPARKLLPRKKRSKKRRSVFHSFASATNAHISKRPIVNNRW